MGLLAAYKASSIILSFLEKIIPTFMAGFDKNFIVKFFELSPALI